MNLPAPRSSERRGEEKKEGKPGFYLGTRNVEQRNREEEMSWEGNGDTELFYNLADTHDKNATLQEAYSSLHLPVHSLVGDRRQR